MRNKNAKVSDPNTFFTCAGDTEHILYSSKILPDGTISLSKSGKENIQEIINSYRDSCDMGYILHMLALGDQSVLNQRQGFYADLSEAPDNLIEAYEIIINGKQAFESLPVEVKQSFNNNFVEWLGKNGSEEWITKMSKVIPDSTEKVNEETKEGESV